MIYFAGNVGSKQLNQYLIDQYTKRLFSFYIYLADNDWGYGETDRIQEWMDKIMKLKKRRKTKTLRTPLLFLDSGAFSAWSKGIEIDIDKYIEFIKNNLNVLAAYAVLDSIGDPKKTLKNQKIMEKAGLSPVPCFHYGEDFYYLEYYLERYDYIALGGMVPISTKDLQVWLEDIFDSYVCDESGMPTTKIHGFGMTSHRLMVRYPWYSLDSTSWVLTGRFGGVYVPKKINGEYNYIKEPWKVNFSSKSSSRKEEGKHFLTFTEDEKKVIQEYLYSKGFFIGVSQHKKVKKDYKLKENEVWFNRKKNEVEVIIDSGVMNDYRKRDEINIQYFLDMEAAMPKWPWRYRPKKTRGFTKK